MTGKGGSPMLCTLSSFCSAEFPCREGEEEDVEEGANPEYEEEGPMLCTSAAAAALSCPAENKKIMKKKKHIIKTRKKGLCWAPSTSAALSCPAEKIKMRKKKKKQIKKKNGS